MAYGLRWLATGHGLALRAQWPGGEHPARVEIAIDEATLEAAATAPTATPAGPLPARRKLHLAATVMLPLGAWNTLAESGAAPATPGSSQWTTRSLAAADHRLLQLRITALPALTATRSALPAAAAPQGSPSQ